MKTRSRVKTRQYDVGYCAICETYGKLTDDHVFLDAVRHPGSRELLALHDHLGVNTISPRIVQGGAKYRTICNKCNTDVLGSRFDPALVHLCKQVIDPLRIAHRSQLLIPNRLAVRYKPMRVARAVVGHSLAAHIIQDVNTPPKPGAWQTALRRFVLDDRLPPPVEIYWWFYPSTREVAINYSALARFGYHGAIFGSFLKFFPFGFWIVFDRPAGVTVNFQRLVPKRAMDVDEEIQDSILLKCPVNPHWPEQPGDDDMLLLADHACVISRPRGPRHERTVRRR